MMPHDALKARVLESVRQHPVPSRTDRTPIAAGLAVLAAAGMYAMLQGVPRLFGEVGGTVHAIGRPLSSGTGILAGTIALAIAGTWIVLPFRRSMLSPPRAILLGVALGVPLLVGAWLVLWHGTYDDPFTRTGWRCFGLTVLTAPWPFLALAYASRRMEPRFPGTAGAALGAVAGAWAAVMVELWCPLSVQQHVLIGHVLPLAALSAVGAAIGATTFRLRRIR